MANKVIANKMAEQVQQATTRDPKKFEAGKRLAEYNHRRREEMKTQKSKTKLTYYFAGAVLAIGFLGVTGYYLYQSKTPRETPVNQTNEALVH